MWTEFKKKSWSEVSRDALELLLGVRTPRPFLQSEPTSGGNTTGKYLNYLEATPPRKNRLLRKYWLCFPWNIFLLDFQYIPAYVLSKK